MSAKSVLHLLLKHLYGIRVVHQDVLAQFSQNHYVHIRPLLIASLHFVLY